MRTIVIVAVGMIWGMTCAAQGQTAQVWVSSADMQNKLTPKDPIAFVKNKTLRKIPCLVVDPEKTRQSMVGIGSSLEHSTCSNLTKLDPAKREEVIDRLVNPESGIGMSLMRICIGTSDFTGDPWYSYDDMPEGSTDPGLDHFTIEKDRAYVLPVLKTARAKNPALQFLASPWSPPGWMKDSGQMCGGRLLPEYYGAFARYLVKFIQTYEAEGIPILAITLQNEPGVNEKTYPSCFWNGEMQRDFIKNHMGPVLKESGLKTAIWCFDHNFNNLPFPRAVLSDPEAAQYVDGTAFHLYEGKPAAMTTLAQEFPQKNVYFTEGSTYGVFGGLKVIEYFRNMARSYNAWVTMIDNKSKPNNGPHECSPTCIVIDRDTLALDYRFDYYMYGHFSKFIRPGAVRLETEGAETRFSNVAFRNPDGAIVLVVANGENEERKFKIQWKKSMIPASLPGKTIATYLWRE